MKKAGAGAPVKEVALSAVEREAQEMLTSDEEGQIDNVFDILEELEDIEGRLPATSSLRPAWDTFYASCMETLASVAD